MLTVFSATNRPGSYSLRVARFYSSRLKEKGVVHQLFSLEQMPQHLLTNQMYEPMDTKVYSAEHTDLMDTYLRPAEKYVFIVPEYNGSFPGVFKAFIDASHIPSCFHNKKCCLVGVADGRAGNLRGMEHLTNIFNHMKMNVLHMKIPFSQVEKHLDEEGNVTNPEIVKLIDLQIDLFNKF
jgi:chromate reductase, NAD(P)H dehydrogenase (quinone)